MKSPYTHAARLGMRQEELCLMLQVHRSQLSMFESGRRMLPKAPLEKLQSLMAALASQQQSQRSAVDAQRDSIRKQMIADLLAENAGRQRNLKTRLERMERKHQIAMNRIEFAAVLPQLPDGKTSGEALARQALKRTAERPIDVQDLKARVGLEIKMELLVAEQRALEAALAQGQTP